jgi:phosphomannomutase
MSLKVSVSGIRGIWGESLTLDVLASYTKAFGMFLLSEKASSRPSVLIGRDGRNTGPLISSYVASILNALGIDVYDAGLVPTPSIILGTREQHFDGGIIITASHNPIEWNALKFVTRQGTFTTEKELQALLGFLNQPFSHAQWNRVGKTVPAPEIADLHIQKVLSTVDSDTIRLQHFTVVIDPVNSAGGPITTRLLEQLECKVIGVNTELTGSFSRVAEPTPANLSHLPDIILRNKAHVGFAQDPDADRLVLIDEKGTILSEELTLAIAINHVLTKTPGPIVVNLSTSLVNELIAERYHQQCFYTKVGEANVVEGIKQHHAIIGGEGNGGVIYPAANLGRDSLVGIALTLEAMATTGKTLSQLVQDFPRLFSIKKKFEGTLSLEKTLPLLQKAYPNGRFSTLDGIRLDQSENNNRLWIHIRASNTEPVVRLIGESTDQGWLTTTVETIEEMIKPLFTHS